jgi:hypothetical protein
MSNKDAVRGVLSLLRSTSPPKRRQMMDTLLMLGSIPAFAKEVSPRPLFVTLFGIVYSKVFNERLLRVRSSGSVLHGC